MSSRGAFVDIKVVLAFIQENYISHDSQLLWAKEAKATKLVVLLDYKLILPNKYRRFFNGKILWWLQNFLLIELSSQLGRAIIFEVESPENKVSIQFGISQRS